MLVFGGGDTHLPIIKACKALGYYTIVTDPAEKPLYAHLADKLAVLDPNDYEGHRRLVQEERIDGLVTCGMENPLPLMARLAEEFGFIHPSPEVVRQVRNKYLMKRKFIEHGVPCARGIKIQHYESLEGVDLSEWSFPLILKPVDSYSSRGVFKVENEVELRAYYPKTAAFASNGEVILEEFMEGTQIGAECITFGGETHVVQTTGYLNTAFPYCVEIELYQPAGLSYEMLGQVQDVVKRAHRAVGLDNCGSNIELMITEEGPKVIEIAGRLGGDHVSSYLPLLSTGVDMNRALAQVAMGVSADLEPIHARFSMIRYCTWEVGARVVQTRPAAEFKAHPWVTHAAIRFDPGDILPPITESMHRHAFFITSGDTWEELRERVDHLIEEIKPYITVEPVTKQEEGHLEAPVR